MPMAKLVFCSFSEKPSERMKPMISRASSIVHDGSSANPKSSMYTIHADAFPLARTMLAATALKRQKVPGDALRPNGRTQ